MSVWTSGVVGDLFLIGSKSDLKLRYSVFLKHPGNPEIDQDLARIGLNDTTLLAKTFKFGPLGAREFLAEFPPDLPVHTDARPVVEFGAPRFLLAPRVARDFNQRSDLTGDLSRPLRLISFDRDSDRLAFAQAAQRAVPQGSAVPALVTP